MKRFSLLMIAVLAGIIVFGQDMKDVKILASLKHDYPKAKEAVDKVLADPKNANSAEAYYWKSYIYNFLAKDDKTKGMCTDCRMDAYDAMKKYIELDPAMKETSSDSNAVLYDIFYSYYDIAGKAYNTQNYELAFPNFKKTLEVEQYIHSKNLPGPNGTRALGFDTTVILLTGVSAAQLKKDDESVEYYKKIIDAGASDPRYLDIYESVADHYKRTKNEAMLNDVVAKGKKIYPNDDYWYQVEIEQFPKSDSKAPLFAKYEEQIKERPNSFFINYNYAIELYKYVYNSDSKPADAETKKNRLTEVIANAIAVDSTSEANVLMARHLDYFSNDISDAAFAIKGAKPEDVKKRNELKAAAAKKEDESVVYAEKAYKYYSALPKLTGRQKSNYRDVLQILSRYYLDKHDTQKSQEYDQKKAAIDKM
ncbi:MAG: hypothetical protein ABJA78_20265 [Ferruginibacter sp.]